MPTIERFDSEGRETLPEHRTSMNAPMRPPRVAMDDVEADEYQALTGLIQDQMVTGNDIAEQAETQTQVGLLRSHD